MDLHQFFTHFLEENELVRANLINDRQFDTKAALVQFKEAEVAGLDADSVVAGMLSMTEVELISHLVDMETDDRLHYVAYDVRQYPVLIDYQYVLEAGDGTGAIHHDIIRALHGILKESGTLPAYPMYIHKDDPLDPEEISQLHHIYKGPIYWLYDNLTWRTLRAMLKRLNVEPDGHQKEDYLRHMTSVITHPKYLEGILLQLGPEEYASIRENVEKSFNVYEASSRWETAKEIGLLVKIHADHYVMHEDVRRALEQVDFHAVETKVRQGLGPAGNKSQGGDYNAHIIRLTVEDIDFEITRTIIVPAGINFFELHLIIQKAMGWQQKHDAMFRSGNLVIVERMNQVEGRSEGTMELLSSFTQIDGVFDQHEVLEYMYGASYRLKVLAENTTNIHRRIPGIRDYAGPAPIENIGGAGNLAGVLEILGDPRHPEYARTYEKVRATNFRERYPITAINNQLEKLFRKSHPITEFNSDETDM
ncbi:plasmid pRiA4b ORF-3 family protein [Salinicoccus sp. ID82-1]|uniref:plasmid pRiA4b ORF-3 family protein n=1 Tax=Salinicoccus sp. ID82-1 TaxID=2820269 RepID=UPI001F4112C3|nr:plasmid pRiA4b ORF-3 family protein [Salinicoccus sp. ID82-1]MCG1009649.1 plasmid pRiA4b ORF-3 family protein [Salinicoccus sp. ID82-1]